MIDIEALKREWRAKAAARGVDVTEGATGYQVAIYCAERAKAAHYKRMARRVTAHAQQHPCNWRNAQGCIDGERVAAQQSRYWWAVSGVWSQVEGRWDSAVMRPTEIEAIYRVERRARWGIYRFCRLLKWKE